MTVFDVMNMEPKLYLLLLSTKGQVAYKYLISNDFLLYVFHSFRNFDVK